MMLEDEDVVQTGKIVAIKKIHLGNAKEVCSLSHHRPSWLIRAHSKLYTGALAHMSNTTYRYSV